MNKSLVPFFFKWPNVWEEDEWFGDSGDNTLDVYETDEEVVVRAAVPGVKAENVEVTFEKGILTITAEEKEEEKDKKRKYYRRAQRNYAYRIAVPGNIDPKQEPEASVEDGVLEVKFKKAEEAKPKKIAVKTKSK